MPELEAGLARKTPWIRVSGSFFRLFFPGVYPTKKVERFPARMAIQNTDEPSSDRLIQEGRPHMRRLSFFSIPGLHTSGQTGRPLQMLDFPVVFFTKAGIGRESTELTCLWTPSDGSTILYLSLD
jgi:hypothetical protein